MTMMIVRLKYITDYTCSLKAAQFLTSTTSSTTYFTKAMPNTLYINTYVFAFVSGWNVLHSVVNILLIYAVLLFQGGTSLSIILAFTINMVRQYCVVCILIV